MASFCFVSFAQNGHLDFGGMSYLRTAIALKKRGHQVSWVLSRNRKRQQHERVVRDLREKGLEVVDNDWLLSLTGTSSKIRDSIAGLGRQMVSSRCDVAVLDRFCAAAQIAAKQCGLPWAAIGTDGLARTEIHLPGSGMKCVTHGIWNTPGAKKQWTALGGDEAGIERSFWCASPFLNISFMPRAFNPAGKLLPSHTHTVGTETDPTAADRRHVLVTFGNSFQEPYLEGVLNALPTLAFAFPQTPFLILTGKDELSKRFRDRLSANTNVEVQTWVDYSRAFTSARVVLGHGGSAFAWHALVTGTPMLAMPTGVGDQAFNCDLIRTLGLGEVVLGHLRHPVLFWRPRHARFDTVELTRALGRLLELKTSSSPLYEAIRSGGGVPAAVSLLETLALTRSPVTTCAAGTCCC